VIMARWKQKGPGDCSGHPDPMPFVSRLKQAIVELAADSRQTSWPYSRLCAAAANAEDAVRSAIPQGFAF